MRTPILCLTLTLTAAAQDWTNWRGPTGNGLAGEDANPPTSFSEEEGVRWKTPLPGLGASTPLVLDGKIYLTSAEPIEATDLEPDAPPPRAAHRLLVLAYGLDSGEELWRTSVGEAAPHEKLHKTSTLASASLVTDGERLVAFFGSHGAFGLDLEGEILWSRDLGDQATLAEFGEGATPALHGDTLVVPWDHEGESFVTGLAVATGEPRWKVERDCDSSWGSPVIVEDGERAVALLTGSDATRAYDLKDGAEVWSCAGMSKNPVNSPTVVGDVLYVTNSYKGRVLQALRWPQASGELAEGEGLLWSYSRSAAYVPNPIVVDGRLYFLRDSTGVLNCLDARTGEELYYGQRLDGIKRVHASPLAAAGRIYWASREGVVAVVKAGAEFEVLATNQLDDCFEASPVAIGKQLLLRGSESPVLPGRVSGPYPGRMPVLRLLLLVALVLPSALAQDHSAVQPVARKGKQHQRFLAMNERVAQGGADLIFVGDSITQGWEGRGAPVWEEFYGERNAVNLGIGGDRTQHVLWRLENGNVDGIDPKLAVVMIGTNNSNREDNTATEIAEGVTAVVRGLRSKLPGCRVLLLDVFPRGAQPGPQRGKILQVNQMLQRLHDGDGVHVLSIGHEFIEDDGSITKAIMPDALHLSAEGYRRWAAAIEPALERLLAAPRPTVEHSVLVAGRNIRTQILSESGEVLWSHPAPSTDATRLPNGNVLMALYPHGDFPGGGVLEVDPAGEVVFSWKATQKEVSTAQLTADGHILVNESGPKPRLLELNRAGEIVHEVPLACQTDNFHMQTRMVRRLANGNYLAPHLSDFAVLEYDRAGKVVRTIPTDERGRDRRDWPFTAIRLANGNTLIGCTNGNRVIEVDEAGEIVWQLTNEDLPSPLIADACGVQRLPNGNTVITSYHAKPGAVHLFEVTRDKHVVWTFAPECAGIHHFQVLTTNGRPVTGTPLR